MTTEYRVTIDEKGNEVWDPIREDDEGVPDESFCEDYGHSKGCLHDRDPEQIAGRDDP